MPEPHPKSKQLARGLRRYHRRVASPAQWAAIVEAKQGPCRCCLDPASNGRLYGRVHFHHLLSRARGGDDVPANIVPLCPDCHDAITCNHAPTLALLAERLEDEEYAYLIAKCGEGALERIFGVGRG